MESWSTTKGAMMGKEELKAARKRLKLTQKELGEKLGLTPDFISKMERGKKEIMPRTELAVRSLEAGKLAG